jgi:subtilisin family serine protease
MRIRLLGAVLVSVSILALSRAESGGQEYIVTLRTGNAIAAVNNAHGTQTIGHIAHTSVYLVKAPGDDTILNDLQNDKHVESAEKNVKVKLRSNSQQASLIGGLSDAMTGLLDGNTLTTFYGTSVLKSYVEQPALTIAHVDEVRSLSTGAGTRVAYIDTGVDPYHPALRPWLDPGVDLLNDRGSSELDGLSDAATSLLDGALTSLLDKRFFFALDDACTSLLDGDKNTAVFPPAFGHGTLVAGIIHVVAPDARIVPIKAFDPYGNTTMFTIVEGVYRAKNLDVDVLNMSFSTTQDSVTLRKAIADAWAAGVAIVASVGNDGNNVSNVFPASYPRVFGVGATDFNDHIASFSNYGKAVSVVATGAFVISTAPGGRYAAAWGTSFSAPMVSGAIALLSQSRGQGHSDSSAVTNTADYIDNLNPGYASQLGKGRINVRRALKDKN